MSFSLAPERTSPSYALRSNRSVMNSLKRETTTAKRRPVALRPPATVLRRISVLVSASVFSVSLYLCCEMVFFPCHSERSGGDNHKRESAKIRVDPLIPGEEVKCPCTG